ncbi:protein eva-1 homolog C isoform X2 [Scleropages formosus]|uniref:protein eva-1 homolog C isoform X2 n=1 Tax=Scleropages formosus TaxID=113540 RepID=UPI0008790995|nr:protein eva-1 homolog C isoform X2 [Scleropages formosus]
MICHTPWPCLGVARTPAPRTRTDTHTDRYRWSVRNLEAGRGRGSFGLAVRTCCACFLGVAGRFPARGGTGGTRCPASSLPHFHHDFVRTGGSTQFEAPDRITSKRFCQLRHNLSVVGLHCLVRRLRRTGPSRTWSQTLSMPAMTRSASHKQRSLLNILCHILFLWTKEMAGLADFSNYLLRIIRSHSAQVCDGGQLHLQCPRHSSISVHSAFYGHSGAPRCSGALWLPEDRARNGTCSSAAALQKVLSECQGHRDCRVPVNHKVFGKDPCPGIHKNLWVSYKCKPTEHKKKVGCEGENVVLRCKSPRLLNIYSAVYGRLLGDEDVCISRDGILPPFECSYYGAVELVTKACYGRQRCVIAVNDHNFRDPCSPGTRKYLTILYACVVPVGSVPYPKGTKLPESNGIVSNSLTLYAYIKAHPELTALLFVSSVCVGLLCALLALSVKVSCGRTTSRCWNRWDPTRQATGWRSGCDMDDDSSELSSSLLLGDEGKEGCCGESMVPGTSAAEAAELAERIERREQVIQEIWMNAYLNGTSQTWSMSPSSMAHCPLDTISFSY